MSENLDPNACPSMGVQVLLLWSPAQIRPQLQACSVFIPHLTPLPELQASPIRISRASLGVLNGSLAGHK